MKKSSNQPTVANALTSLAKAAMTSAANSRSVFCFHQPKQPKELKKFART